MSNLQLNVLRTRSRSRSPAAATASTVIPHDSADQDKMASATGIPDGPVINDDSRAEDYEPLLGQPGDQVQEEDKPMPYNLVTGTGIIAQAGILIMAATVWAAVFTHALIWPFSFHPVANSTAALLSVQAALILQPTHTPNQKRVGALLHGAFNGLAFVLYLAALVAIFYNKSAHGGEHFVSIHAIMGLTTYIVLLIQSAVGFTMYFVPSLYGSVENAKSIWKYHRMSGYTVLTLGLATICASTTTDYNNNVLGMEMWVMVVASILVLAGLLSRVKLQKFGLKTGSRR